LPSDPALAKKTKLVRRIKDIILGIIGENNEGVSLAQIPLLLRRKLGFSVNFQELGFPKLKNFITTAMADQVKIESSGANHSFAILKEPLKKLKGPLKQFSKPYGNQPSSSLIPSQVRSAEPVTVSSRKLMTPVDDYLAMTKHWIKAILKENSYGIPLYRLQNDLNARLSSDFDPNAF